VTARLIRPAKTLCPACKSPATLRVDAPGTDAPTRQRCRDCVLPAVAALLDTLAAEHLTAAVTVRALEG
jgi:hypothetical protein